MPQKRMCVCVGCEKVATPRTPFCKNCGQGLNHWSHRRVGEREKYKTQLQVRSSRLDHVTSIRKRK